MAVTRYMEIITLQSPISIGNDTSQRAMLSFNVLCRLVGVQGRFEEEICKLISNAGLAALGTDMWYGSLAQIPQDNHGPLVSVSSTGGLSPLQTHNNDKQYRPSAQIIVRGADYDTTLAKSLAIHSLLDGKHNVNVTL